MVALSVVLALAGSSLVAAVSWNAGAPSPIDAKNAGRLVAGVLGSVAKRVPGPKSERGCDVSRCASLGEARLDAIWSSFNSVGGWALGGRWFGPELGGGRVGVRHLDLPPPLILA